MTIEDKNITNKLIRKYDGKNEFVLSLKRQLKSNAKYITREKLGNRTIKVLSEKQYEVVIGILEQEF